MADIYQVGIAIDTSDLERGTQQARQAMTQLGQTESQLERQTKQTDQATKAFGQTQTLLERGVEQTSSSLIQQATALTRQARDARNSAAALREHAAAARRVGDALKASTLEQQARALSSQARDARHAAQALREQARAQATAERGATGLRSTLQGMLGPFVSLQGAATALGAYLGGQFVRSVLETAGRMETLQLSLDAITGSTRAGADAMLFARQTAHQFGLATADVAATYRGFLANTNGLNLGITTTQQLFTGLMATTKLVGGSADTLANAVRGLTQTFAVGKLDAENWKGQVEEALPILASALPRALGLTRQAFMEQMQAGQLTIDRVLKPLVQVLGEQIPKAAGIAATSMESASARMKNSLSDLWSAIGQSPIARSLTDMVGDAARAMHDFGARVGALDPRPLTEIQRLTERIADLREDLAKEDPRTLNMPQRIDDLKTIADLEVQRLGLIRQQAAAQKTAMEQEEAQRKAATTGPTGVTKTLTTQIEQETAAWQRRYAVGQTVGLPQLERERAKLADLNTVLHEHLDVLASTTPMTDADRKAREAQAIAVQDQIEATEGVIKALQDEERERNKPPRDARRTRGGVTEEHRADNDLQREQNQLIDELTAAYDRATQSEAGLLALRARRLQFPETEIAELLHVQELTQQTERQRQAAEDAQQAYESYYETLMTDLKGIVRAQEHGISLEEAREEVTIRQVARTDDEYQTLLALNAERRTGLGLLEEQAAWQEAMTRAAMEIEDQVRSPELPETIRETQRATEDLATSLTGNLLGAIEEVTQTGTFSFRKFAESVIGDLLRVLQQTYLKPAMEGWVQAGLKLATGVLGMFGGAGGAYGGLSQGFDVAAQPYFEMATGGPLRRGLTLVGEAGPEAIVSRGGRAMVFPTSHPISRMAVAAPPSFETATGGPLRSGVTLVGEAGPEAIVSRGGRAMVFPTSHPISRMAVAAHLPGRQFGGPLPSAVMGSTGSDPASATMSASSGPQGRGVTQNFYIQTPDAQSFVKSKGEIQRQMLAAFRASQRS